LITWRVLSLYLQVYKFVDHIV